MSLKKVIEISDILNKNYHSVFLYRVVVTSQAGSPWVWYIQSYQYPLYQFRLTFRLVRETWKIVLHEMKYTE